MLWCAKILCVLKIARFSAATAVPSRLSLHPPRSLHSPLATADSMRRTYTYTYTCIDSIHFNRYAVLSRLAMRFIWNENKNRQNLRKHDVRFETSVLVFEDP